MHFAYLQVGEHFSLFLHTCRLENILHFFAYLQIVQHFAFFLHICIFAYLQVGEQDRGAAFKGGGEGEQGPGDFGGDLQVGIFAKKNTNTNKHRVDLQECQQKACQHGHSQEQEDRHK